MIVLNDNNIAYFDVDETLIKWDRKDLDNLVPIHHPGYEWKNEDGDSEWYPGFTEFLSPHKFHVEQLKKHKANNYKIVVWSQAGWEWAEAVIKALKLEEYVDVICAKPLIYYDDLPSTEFMGTNRFWSEDK